MVRRLILLLSAAALGWYLVSRLRRPREDDFIFDEDGFAVEETRDGPAGQASDTTAGAGAATQAAVQAPVDRIRSIVGEHGEEQAAGEPAAPVTTEAAGAGEAQAGYIKGNVRNDGVKIYHLPGDPAYDRTNAEQTFHSIAEAEAAGFRRARQT